MTTTRLEKRLSRPADGILVPLIEDYHQEFHRLDSDDLDFLHDLMTRVAEREDERDLEEPVYSPSGLGGCLRHSFLNRHHKKLGIPAKVRSRIETNFYFENGYWLHLKNQVILYKLHKMGEIELLGTECTVVGKRGDNRGTLDAVFRRDSVVGLDVKGWNQRDFQRVAGGDCPLAAQIQLANYIILANAGRGNSLPRIDVGLILAENKAGPTSGFPAAVAEYEIPLITTKQLVRERLGRLREHEEAGTTPEAECQSTLQRDFKECPFRDHCTKEVKRNERRGARKSTRGYAAGSTVEVAQPKRTHRSRRDRSKRGLHSS